MYRIVRVILAIALLVGAGTEAPPALAAAASPAMEEASPSLFSRLLERVFTPLLTLASASQGGPERDPDGLQYGGGPQGDPDGVKQDGGAQSDPNG